MIYTLWWWLMATAEVMVVHTVVEGTWHLGLDLQGVV